MLNIEKNILKNIDISKYSSFKTGGKADLFFYADTTEKLKSILSYTSQKDIPFFVVGGGTNILFSDRGLRGMLIVNATSEIDLLDDNYLICSSGVKIEKLMSFCLKNGLSGAEFLTGLPGTIGGAIYGNAGANGSEISNLIENVELFSKDKGFFTLDSRGMSFSYRNSVLKANEISKIIAISAKLKLNKGEIFEIKDKMRNSMVGRVKNHPSKLTKSCGCFFKNPSQLFNGEKVSAGKLLDMFGSKNIRVGNASVSKKHCNFLINESNCSSSDIFELAKKLKDVVFKNTGIILENEVRIISDEPPFLSIPL
ncbi:UDP-N-acetylmuramate dehydrogenase [bacterium]|nr:UDP-N-acetylmuramate dehydrogenase [bacterium]